ncbi:MAG: hypothetical protein JSS81_17375 [Acidobacteria bacterium]|nr:hypothetical protein [Acidobacteriota bacterium]
MTRTRFFRRYLGGLLLALLTSAAAVSAQSAIFNIPSTDVMGEKRFYVEADFLAHFGKWDRGGFQSYGYRTVYGVRKKLEVGINFFYTRNGSTGPKELQPNFKYKIYEKEKYGLAVAAGAQVFMPLNRSAGRRTYVMLYSNASKVFKRTNETRVTGGFYRIAGAESDFGSRSGALLGIEQPIKGKLSFAGDWYTGKNRLGYAAAGLTYSFTKRQFLMVGYNFGNEGRANNYFSAFYGFTY